MCACKFLLPVGAHDVIRRDNFPHSSSVFKTLTLDVGVVLGRLCHGEKGPLSLTCHLGFPEGEVRP